MNDEPLRLIGLTKTYGGSPVLDGIDLAIRRGEFVALVGPSGCGKTTLLNLLSGHMQPTAGTVAVSGVRRTVYQQDGLFPWLSVAENIRLGLGGIPLADAQQQMTDLLALAGLGEFAGHYPHQLSGGMRQRAELARALAGESDILLMDEPFSSLDYQTRLRLRRELVAALDRRPRTVVFVTHDIEEAAQLADRVIVLSERPARIQAELPLAGRRPRAVTDPDVIDAVQRLFAVMGLDEKRQPAPA